ncbi:MAG TPA: DUF448 domain-containing protein [bacterium]|nr:DUF448 domain-containing protein [bacterium]
MKKKAATTNKGPSVRSCVACGEKSRKETLVRFVLLSGEVAPDWRGTLEGRAVYACPTPDCVRKLYAVKRLPDAFLQGAPRFAVPREEILAWIRDQAIASLTHFLSLARKSGVLTTGQNTIADAMERDGKAPAAVLMTADTADRTVREVTRLLPAGTPILRWGDQASLGAAIGTRPVGVVALAASPITERIRHYGAMINLFSLSQEH